MLSNWKKLTNEYPNIGQVVLIKLVGCSLKTVRYSYAKIDEDGRFYTLDGWEICQKNWDITKWTPASWTSF